MIRLPRTPKLNVIKKGRTAKKNVMDGVWMGGGGGPEQFERHITKMNEVWLDKKVVSMDKKVQLLDAL